MILFPPAKINIGLNVVQKRIDGYHELETIMLQVPLFDVLEIIPSEQLQWKQTGLTVEGNSDQNLCIRAFQLLQKSYDLKNVYMHLDKCIPMGAGLGGGSADAAYVIRAINELFNLKLSKSKQMDIAASLGSDCALFIEDTPQLATGRGEILSPIELPLQGKFLHLIKPSIHISTAQAFGGVHISGDNGQLAHNIQQDITSWKENIKNDFEKHLFELYPELSDIKNSLYTNGAVYASMSGSGSTMYGIYDVKPLKLNRANCTEFILPL